MFKTFINAIKVRDIRKKILYTLVALIIVRLGSNIVVPGITSNDLKDFFKQLEGLDFITAFTGNAFEKMSIFALGITPYITSSIIMQLLTIAIPKLEEMQKDGEDGRKKIAEITRYVTVILAIIESLAITIGFKTQGQLHFESVPGGDAVVIAMMVLSMTAGSAFLMWLGENITQKGVGNGISIILLINIVSRIPDDMYKLGEKFYSENATRMSMTITTIVIAAIVAFVVVFVIYLSDGERRIPVQYAKKLQGRRQVGGQSTYIPLKVNTAGVIPVIFTTSLLQLPVIISRFFNVSADSGEGATVWQKILKFISANNWFRFGNKEGIYTLGVLLYLVLLVFFAYFYTSITFNPIEVSNNMKKQGGFVPGIRPGKPTTEYLTGVLNNIILIGATGLAIVAVIPLFFEGFYNIQISFGGTSLIIIVGVILETMKQVESQMLVRHYKGFLSDN